MERTTTPTEAIDGSLARIAAVEPWLHAFAWLDPDRARRLARESATAGSRGPLHGVPIGVKDIVDTAGIPTENGSAIFRGRVPSRSATLVDRLERAGAIVVGKTVTAELAYYHPGPTVNPYDRSRTPGGSSMGSAAAVATGEVQAAVGSQTNGSTIRPAAFCGVVGFKPTHGRVPTDGVMAFAPTLDTLGVLARTVALARTMAAVMAGDEPSTWSARASSRPRFAVVRTGDWDRAEPAACERFDADCERLEETGAEVVLPRDLEWIDEAVPALRTIMFYEGAHGLGRVVDRDQSLASTQIRSLVTEGRTIEDSAYRLALDARRALIARYEHWAAEYDAVLTLPALGEAPAKDTTGDPRLCTRWTLLGVPAITIPTGLGPHGLPLGLQLAGRTGADAALVAAAEWAAARLQAPPPPSA